MNKIVKIGHGQCGAVYLKIQIRQEDDKQVLSISGVEGPQSNGNCKGGCGQIEMSMDDAYLDYLRYNTSEGWDRAKVVELLVIWRKWHLNDMRAGCEHQRRMGWDKIPIDPSKPLNAYGNFAGCGSSWNMATWVTRKNHPDGLLSEPCPECGYEYGSAWLYEPLPANVISWLEALPPTKSNPAWV